MGIEWTKSRAGKWLLLSLIPAILGLIVVGVQSPDELFEGEFFWSFLLMALILYWPSALVAGITLSVWGSIDQKRQYREAQQYAQRHGWHPISRTSWRNRKRNGIELAVNKAIGLPTYILTIVIEGETTMVDEFTTPTWSMDFGDWLWEELLLVQGRPDVRGVVEKRAEWEQSRGLAVYHGPR